MKAVWVGVGALAALVVVTVLMVVQGVSVTVISINNVSEQALETVRDILPVEEGIYCALEACCTGEGGVSAIDPHSGDVICASGAVSATCRCERRNVSAEM